MQSFFVLTGHVLFCRRRSSLLRPQSTGEAQEQEDKAHVIQPGPQLDRCALTLQLPAQKALPFTAASGFCDMTRWPAHLLLIPSS